MASNNLQYILSLKNQFSSTMQGALKQTQTMDSQMKNLKNSIAGAFVVGGIVSFGKAVIDSLKNYEYFHASIKVLLYGNEQAAASLERQLVSLAKTTPFSLVEVQDATKQLLAYGFAAGDVTKNISMLGDVASALAIPFSDMAYLYGTTKTQGRLMSRDMLQFQTRGIPLQKELAKQFGKTSEEITKMVSEGKIGFKEVEKAFKSMTGAGGQFFGMMAAQNKTVGGRLSALGDSWEQLKVKIGQSQTGIISSTVTWASSLVDGVNRGIDAMNALDRAFKGSEKSQFSFYQKYIGRAGDKLNSVFGIGPMSGGYEDMLQYQSGMEQNLGGGKDRISTLKNSASLNQIIANVLKDSSIGSTEKDMRVNILRDILKKNEGALGLFGLKENTSQTPTTDENGNKIGGSSKSSSMGSGVDVTGQRPQSLTINITKLVEALNINTSNITEGYAKIKEGVSKALLEAVNDVNLMQTA